uniref:Uncharacterized protein n=1 Tax=Anguilla anguilla TaxID=7936 RepID=A0A0E9SJU8_ANGAN
MDRQITTDRDLHLQGYYNNYAFAIFLNWLYTE